jgi:hypothetical protein
MIFTLHTEVLTESITLVPRWVVQIRCGDTVMHEQMFLIEGYPLGPQHRPDFYARDEKEAENKALTAFGERLNKALAAAETEESD